MSRRSPRAALVAGMVAAGLVSGGLAATRTAGAQSVPVPTGRVAVIARVMSDPLPADSGHQMLVSASSGRDIWAGTVFLVATDEAPLAVGDLVNVDGTVADRPGRHRGDPYRAVIGDADVELVRAARGPVLGPGNWLRAVVLRRIGGDESGDADALLAGFLVGDTTRLSETAGDDLRRAGLTHFVAVSGSNVAVFLGAWWLVMGPLGLPPRLRATAGLCALAVFVVATRWEPSVVRAAAMAGTVLAGRIGGVPVDAWRALGFAVSILLLVSGDLATEVGFQLSVAATVGVLVAARLAPMRRPRWMWTTLSATIGAQLAVLPIVLWRFGTVPLLSPLSNVVATPLVTVATAVGGVGLVTGFRPAVGAGVLAAEGVLAIASHAAGWPQLGPVAALAAVATGCAAATMPALRPLVAVTGLAMLAAAAASGAAPTFPSVTFLDVGQGDAILVRDPVAGTALVDGGRDPAVLRAALRRQGVDEIDLVVASHGDADHVGGLTGIVADFGVDVVWYPDRQVAGELLEEVLEEADDAGATTVPVGAGGRAHLGTVALQLLGPERRYAADNDGSVVMLVSSDGVDVLLTGDIEHVAQSDLPGVRPDVLQVPHHGSTTSDVDWLLAVVGELAVISVGPNTYGHPAPSILAALTEAGVEVRTTWDDGDVVVPLCSNTCRPGS